MKLKDICEINPRTQGIDNNTEVSFVPMPSVSEDGKIDTSDIRIYQDVKKGYTVFRENDVLFAKITPCMENGKGAVARGLMNGIGCGSSEFHVLRPNKEIVTSEWIYYLTAWGWFRKEAEKHMTGSAGQRRVPKTYLENYVINIPSLSEQAKQVEVLSQLQQVIDDRKKELMYLDELIKARFVEMFGDPVINPMHWEICTVGDVIESTEAGWSGNGTQRPKMDGEIAVLKVSAVTKGYFIPEECKVLDDQINIKKYVYPHMGDLLFSRANTREMVGATAIIETDYPELILPDKLWRIRFTPKTNVYYMKHILSSQMVRNAFSEASTGTSGSMFNVSMDKFRAVKIPMPCVFAQNEFEQFVKQVDKSKFMEG